MSYVPEIASFNNLRRDELFRLHSHITICATISAVGKTVTCAYREEETEQVNNLFTQTLDFKKF